MARGLGLLDLAGFGALFWQNTQQNKQLRRMDEQDDLSFHYFKEILHHLERLEAMSKFREAIDKIDQTPENMQQLTDICDTAMNALHKSDKAAYSHAMHELEGMAWHISKAKAEELVGAMKPYGAHWSHAEVLEYLKSKGIEGKCIEYYLCMNMAYNDYRKTAELAERASDPDFYFSLAKDFISDVDGKPFKVQKYFLGV